MLRHASFTLPLLMAFTLLATPAHAAWTSNGNAVKTGTGTVDNVTVLADGAGGAYIAWQDNRNGAGNTDVFVTRVSNTGIFMTGWGGVGGTNVSPVAGDQVRPRLALDGSGGVFVTWQDSRTGAPGIYAQHFTGVAGLSPGWPFNGNAIQLQAGAGYATTPEILPDGSGGAFIAWPQGTPGTNLNVIAQRINSAGTKLWAPSGVSITTLAARAPVSMVADGTNLFVAYGQNANWGSWLQKLGVATGSLEWAWQGQYGVQVGPMYGDSNAPPIVTDGAGGVLVGIEEISGNTATFYVARYGTDGDYQWSQVPCNGTYAGVGGVDHPQLVSDGAGGAVAAWKDDRNGTTDLYAMHIGADGMPVMGWPAAGQQVVASVGGWPTALTSDGRGGAIAAWGDVDITARNIASGGGLGSPINLCNDAGTQNHVALAWTQSGYAIAGWIDSRTGGANTGVYANLVQLTAFPAAVTPFVASGPVNSAITWVGPADDPLYGPAIQFEVRRSSSPITLANWAAATLVDVVPSSGTPGTSYCTTAMGLTRCRTYYYGLRTTYGTYASAPGTASSSTRCNGNFLLECDPMGPLAHQPTSDEDLADRPLEFRLSSGNPAQERATFELAIPADRAGEVLRVGIYDVSGRQLASLVSGSGLAGSRSIEWDLTSANGGRVAPGAYFARMSLGSSVITRTLVVSH